MRPQEFDDHLTRFEDILAKLNATPVFAKCGCIDIDARGLHSSLRSEIAKWTYDLATELEHFIIAQVKFLAFLDFCVSIVTVVGPS